MRRESLVIPIIALFVTGFAVIGPPSEAAKYYVGPSREIKSLSEVMNRLQPGDTVYLTNGTYSAPEVISAKGTADKPITICPAPGQKPIIQRTTWKLQKAQYVVLTGLTFSECALALELLEDAAHNTFQKNRFINCPPLYPKKLKEPSPWERALCARGPRAHYNHIIDNEFKREYESIWSVNESLNVLEGNQYWVIRDNRIEGYMYGMQLGIGSLGGPPGYILVEGNRITNCNEGIHIKTGDNRIRGNYIADLKNHYQGCGTGIYLRSCPRTVVENNHIERAHWAGIRIMGNNQVIRNNIVIDTPVGAWLSHHSYGRAKESNWIVHNTIVDAVLPVWLESEAQAFVHNNILAAKGGKAKPAVGIYVAGLPDENPMVAEKAGYERMSGRNHSDNPGALIANHNLYFNTLPPTRSPAKADDDRDFEWWRGYDVLADPGFVDVKRGDWRLKPDSPARNAGRPLPNAALDINGVVRPDRPDFGAYQTNKQQK